MNKMGLMVNCMREDCESEVQVHFFLSKFAKLQPKQCVMALVMAGSASTRSVFIFTIHQNVKLMMIAAKLGKLTENDSTPPPCSLQPLSRTSTMQPSRASTMRVLPRTVR